jgi:CheY-like chemotaxis protein
MDVQMPEMGGFEAAAAIRQREASQGGSADRLPIVALTAHALKGDRERCLEAGMDDYVSKPVRAQELFEAIARVVGRPVAAPATQAPQLDRNELLTRVVGGDADLLREVVTVFLDSYPGMLTELEQAVNRGDAPAVQRAAHALKGAAAHFNVEAATDAAWRLEVMGRDRDLEDVKKAFTVLAEALERLRPALTRLLDDGAT